MRKHVFFFFFRHEIGPFSRVKAGENFAFQAYFATLKQVKNGHFSPSMAISTLKQVRNEKLVRNGYFSPKTDEKWPLG